MEDVIEFYPWKFNENITKPVLIHRIFLSQCKRLKLQPGELKRSLYIDHDVFVVIVEFLKNTVSSGTGFACYEWYSLPNTLDDEFLVEMIIACIQLGIHSLLPSLIRMLSWSEKEEIINLFTSIIPLVLNDLDQERIDTISFRVRQYRTWTQQTHYIKKANEKSPGRFQELPPVDHYQIMDSGEYLEMVDRLEQNFFKNRSAQI